MSAQNPDNIEERLRQREALLRHPLATIPTTNAPPGNISNTPLAISTIAFLLGGVFSLGAITFVAGGSDVYWWSTHQLGFFVAAWAGFHWGEFAVTAGWNLEKCSVDCECTSR
jgi:protein-S-isoprenylcysteine O-methyltransferase